LNTTSPVTSPAWPKERPSKTVPSSSAIVAGGRGLVGFGFGAFLDMLEP
jgi:hypothetical protein